jgi:hypothetical protein
MKTVKIIGLVIWGFLTIGLIMYGSNLRTETKMKQKAIDELLYGMADLLDSTKTGDLLLEFQSKIDSLEIEINEKDSLISILGNK